MTLYWQSSVANLNVDFCQMANTLACIWVIAFLARKYVQQRGCLQHKQVSMQYCTFKWVKLFCVCRWCKRHWSIFDAALFSTEISWKPAESFYKVCANHASMFCVYIIYCCAILCVFWSVVISRFFINLLQYFLLSLVLEQIVRTI